MWSDPTPQPPDHSRIGLLVAGVLIFLVALILIFLAGCRLLTYKRRRRQPQHPKNFYELSTIYLPTTADIASEAWQTELVGRPLIDTCLIWPLISQMPPRRYHPPCPCGGNEDTHYFHCWMIHILSSMAVAIAWVMFFFWLFSQPKLTQGQDSICAVCSCSSHKLLCPDRGFRRLPDVSQDMIDTVRILGFQRNSLDFISGSYLARYKTLLMIDIRDQIHGRCVRVLGSIPENIIVRGMNDFIWFFHLTYFAKYITALIAFIDM